MKLFRILFASVLVSIVFSAGVSAEELDAASRIEKYSMEKEFVILKSTRDYKDVLRTAETASRLLEIKLDLRGLTENKESGLTLDKKICEEEGDGSSWPCYYARGRYDDGTYLSIEYSSAFQGFRKGYYIVVAASYPKVDKEISSVLKQAKTHYPDAYSKTTKVYMGCMH